MNQILIRSTSLLMIFLYSVIASAISVESLDIQLNRSEINQLDPITRAVAIQIANKSDVNFEMVSAAVFEQHYRAFLSSPLVNQLERKEDLMMRAHIRFSSLLKDGPSDSTKVDIENIITSGNPSDLLYNSSHSSIFSPLFLDRVQCYSGSMLYDLVRRANGKSVHKASNRVFIFTKGHVLPGYIKEKQGQLNLFGIETTVAGKAKRDFGPLADLSEVRVVDADLGLTVELMKKQILNLEEVVIKVLQLTAIKYNLPLDQMEKSINSTVLSLSESSDPKLHRTAKLLNSSAFGFGSSNAPSDGQDINRAQVDEIPFINNKENLHITAIAGKLEAELEMLRHIEAISLMYDEEPIVLSLPAMNDGYGIGFFSGRRDTVIIEGSLAKSIVEEVEWHKAEKSQLRKDHNQSLDVYVEHEFGIPEPLKALAIEISAVRYKMKPLNYSYVLRIEKDGSSITSYRRSWISSSFHPVSNTSDIFNGHSFSTLSDSNNDPAARTHLMYQAHVEKLRRNQNNIKFFVIDSFNNF